MTTRPSCPDYASRHAPKVDEKSREDPVDKKLRRAETILKIFGTAVQVIVQIVGLFR